MLETMINLAQRPRSDAKTLVLGALDTLVELINVADMDERSDLLDRAIGCGALHVCLNVGGCFHSFVII